MVVDRGGYRLNVGIILVNDAGRLFWGRRVGSDAWQFPQGGVRPRETVKQAMHRELMEEVGLEPGDVEILGVTKRWLRYRLPKQYIRRGPKPVVIGQKQKWFILKLRASEQKIRLDASETPEFDSWRWVDYDEPPEHVIFFKRHVYRLALDELQHHLETVSKPDTGETQ